MVVCIIVKIASDIYHVFWFCLRRIHSVPMISPAPVGQISMKINAEDSNEELQIWLNSDKYIGHFTRRTKDDFSCRRNKFAIKTFLYNNKNFYIVDSIK
jgi:hypothetical protein